ncbi:MAG: HD domain-containing protein [Syntrophobacteraceae bacterium]
MSVTAGSEPTVLSSRFREALWLAAFLHADQRRKGTGIPYVAHLLAVSSLVLENGGNEDAAIAGLLHDSVEDQGGETILEQIAARFGPSVATIVEACSDSKEIPKPPWRARKERYIDHLADVTSDTLLVSLADKLHNARAILADYRQIGDALWERFQGGRDGTLWYYEALVAAFERRTEHGRLVEELRRVVTELQGLAAP